MEKVDIVVVGAGIAGLSAAWRIAAGGREVVLFERFGIANNRGSSHGATRIFRLAYDDPTYVRLAQAALPLWRELEDVSGHEILRITGGVDIGIPGYLEATANALHQCGARVEHLSAAARRERYPWLEAGDEPAIFSPDTGVVAAARALDATANAARKAGASLRVEMKCDAIEPHGGAVDIVTAHGTIRANKCVVAAGGWTAPLLATIGIQLPVYVSREQVFYFRSPTEIVPFIHRGSIDRYAVPMFAGAPGVKVAEHCTGERTSAEGRSFEMDPEGAARVADYVAAVLPRLDPEPIAFETCLYTMTPDEGFVLDVVGPVVVASACSGHGFKFGPIVGEMAAALATGRRPPVDAAPFAPDRFAS